MANELELQKELLQVKGLDPAELQQKLAELERQVANSNRARFGKSTEQRKTPKDEDKAEPKPQPGHGPSEQPNVKLVDEIHQLDKPDQTCPQCGGELKEWVGQFEESELIDAVERKFFIRKLKRQKYRCGCASCVETALGPTILIPGGRYSPDFAVEVAVSKYLDHAPLQRQVRTWRARASRSPRRPCGIKSRPRRATSSRHTSASAKLSDMNPKDYVRSALSRAINGAPALLPNELLQAELDAGLAPVESGE